MRAYADEIGVDQETIVEAFQEVPSMSSEQFNHIAQALYTLANQLSTTAFQNVQQARFIADRNRVEAQLKENDEKLQTIINTSLDGYFILTLDGSIQEVNAEYCKMTGYSQDELLKKSIVDLDVHENSQDALAHIQKVVQNGTDQFETQHRCKDGSLIDIEISTTYLKSKEYLLTFARNISERKQIEKALLQSEAQYRLLFNEMAEGFALHEIICDDLDIPIDYRFLEVNPMFEKMTGLKKEKIIGKTVLEVMPNTESYWIHTYGKVALTGEEIRYENYSEELGKWFDVIAFSPKPGQFATTVNDITDRKIMETEIRESEEKYRAYVNQAPFGVFVTDENGNYIQVNAAASKITGYTRPELLKMKIPDLFQEQTLEAAAIHFESVKNNGYASGEFPFLNKKQEVRWFSVTGVKLSENRFLGFVEDITDRKKADMKLQEQLDELTRWHSATLGRENRIMELKKEVNQLLKKHNLPVRYTSIEEG